MIGDDPLRQVTYADTLDYLYERRCWLKAQISRHGPRATFGPDRSPDHINTLYAELKETEIRMDDRMKVVRYAAEASAWELAPRPASAPTSEDTSTGRGETW